MEHPIEGLMKTAMQSIQDMVDVNTIIGEPIETTNGMVIIPISKVNFGFAAGGSEFSGETIDEYKRKDKEEEVQYRLPFGGGSGAGVNINPIAFLVVQSGNVKLLPVNHASAVDKLLDYMPDAIDKMNNLLNKQMQMKNDEKTRKQHSKEESKETIQKEPKGEKVNQVISKSKPRRGRRAASETYEYEYNEVPPAEDILIDVDETEEFDE